MRENDILMKESKRYWCVVDKNNQKLRLRIVYGRPIIEGKLYKVCATKKDAIKYLVRFSKKALSSWKPQRYDHIFSKEDFQKILMELKIVEFEESIIHEEEMTFHHPAMFS